MMDTEKHMQIESLIKYLGVLQEGKVRPNNSRQNNSEHCCNVRDSKDNIPDITAVKAKLANMLGLDQVLIEEKQKSN